MSLAAEAQVERHLLTHRHTDLKDEFYAKVRARGHVPDSERRLREELIKAKQNLAEAREHAARLGEQAEDHARVVNLLTMENDELKNTLRAGENLRALPIRG